MTRSFLPFTILFVALGLIAVSSSVVAQRAVGKKLPDEFHNPANAVKNLTVAKDLEVTLFASEPTITNPTNLDVDHRGRVWICDVMNYRNKGKRDAGDRILILEDKDGDGKADDTKVFYQGKDVDSAMGICVLGDKVIVSCSPNILLFTFDKDDKILKKEYLFTKTGKPQHDHTAHSFVFGPDGKLYWNFGNEGHAVHDAQGKPVVDLAGNTVNDKGKPYRQGMVFRCDLDGSNFEVLAHNFRNNYEVAVDSFGTLWQSDNDDDGNKGIRVNYVMEYGNYGFTDELTGAGWRSGRTNIEPNSSLRHWHLNDPGVVPNLMNLGAGSPSGILFHEADLLPKQYRNQMILAESGYCVVLGFPMSDDGAGYQAKKIDLVSEPNNWFRPADLCVAPDGSIILTDWYDPGVGGHNAKDMERGRIFRLAPPRTKYQSPKFDFTTVDGAAEALKNPNLEARYRAWMFLHEKQAAAEPALLKLWKSDNSYYRARALWLLAKIKGKGQQYVDLALQDKDADIRIVGLRLARQLKLDLPRAVAKVVRDPSPQVRREAAIALRFEKSTAADTAWAELAVQHDGKDRWYLEALGIGADLHWDGRFDAWEKLAGAKWSAEGPRDVIWRSRAKKTPTYLARVIAEKSVPAAEVPRFFRAFDFQQKGAVSEEALFSLAFGPKVEDGRQTVVALEATKRLKGFDPNKDARAAALVNQLLDQNRDSLLYVDLVGKYGIAARYPDLLALARKNPEEQLGVNAVQALLDKGQIDLLKQEIRKSDAAALEVLRALGTAADARTSKLLLDLAKEAKEPVDVRRQAVRSLARSVPGAKELLEWEKSKQLPKELHEAAGAALHVSQNKAIREQATALFPLPAAKDNASFPPISELVKQSGDVGRGKQVFAAAGTCANCHVVNGAGKDVGPNLSEIGKKLNRESLLESILYPSAGISHGYDQFTVAKKDGTLLTGLLVSQTAEEIVLKGADAIVRTIKSADLDGAPVRSPISLMPADLTRNLTVQDVNDIVEYMQTLRESAKGQ